MQSFQKALARIFAVLLTFSVALSPVLAQTGMTVQETQKGARDAEAIQASGRAPTKSTAVSERNKKARKAEQGRRVTPRNVLTPKEQRQKAQRVDARAVGGVGLNGYPPLLIGPGDLLAILVYGEEELPIEYQVDSDGIITYPYVGTIHLGGLSPAEASEKVARLLGKERKVTVLIKESNTYWVSILGHVGKPGKYQIHGKPTLLSALAEAGGPIPGAKLNSAVLIHRGVKTKVNLDKYLKGEGPTGQEPLLFPSDVLVVPKSGTPSIGEMAIVASILASVAVVAVQMNNIRK